ncbi:MAG: hypothetical protein ACI4BA_07960 [Prevotella sp.]
MNRILTFTWVMAAALFAASCDDKNDDNYEAAPAIPADCIGVYFDSTNPTGTILVSEDEKSVEIALSRRVTDEAASVPITCVSKEEGIVVPATAEFQAGEATTSISITCDEIQLSRICNFTLAIDERYADHYTIVDGATTYEGSILKAAWQTVSENVVFTLNYRGENLEITSTLEQLGETNRYRIKNFLGSSMDMYFNVTGDASVAGYSKMEPYANYEPYDGTEANGFYLIDGNAETEEDKYPAWTLADGTVVSWICILQSYPGYGDYTYISLDKHKGRVSLYMMATGSGAYYYYVYINFKW